MKRMHQAWIPAFAGMTLLLTACGDSTLYTNAAKKPVTTTAESAELGPATITQNAFLFASPYPARIIIPDIDGMRSTAFVVSTLNPAGVVALDLESTPIRVSTAFKGVTSPANTGIPNTLAIQSATRAFMLTSSHIIDFNPTSGAVRSVTAIPKSITLPNPLPLSGPLDFDNDGDIDTTITEIPLSFPGGIAIAGGALWVTTANYLRYATPAVAAPGILLRYPITDTGLAIPTSTASSGYNPTGIAATASILLVTHSGVLNIAGGEASPQTASSIDVVDIATGAIAATIPADLSALAFFAPGIDDAGQFAYYGSSAFSEVYQLDIAQKKWTHGLLDPIAIGPQDQADFLTAITLSHDGHRAYVGSFDHSRVFVLDMTSDPVRTLSTSYSVGFSKGVSAENPSGATTGVSDIAVRPGTPGRDFKGPEIFVLTGNPGTLVTIGTEASAKELLPTLTAVEISPQLLPLQVGKVSWLAARSIYSDGNPGTVPIHWTSDDPKVAVVSAEGLVTATGPGITRIHASTGDIRATATVAVHQGAVTAEVPPPQLGKFIVVTCFATHTLDYKIGAGGGANQDKLPQIITGPPNGSGAMNGSTDTFSLGAKGTIIVAFQNCRIQDGDGPDFIVFENAFYAGGNPKAPFSEPAVVGVSADGISYTDFPCDLLDAPMYPGCAGTHPVYANPQNGIDPFDPKASGGDPFDLKTVGIKEARFIRIVDQGLTPFFGANGSNGFDLDAIAVIHAVKPIP